MRQWAEMRHITTAFKSSKIATLLALSLVVAYAATQFGEYPSQMAYAKLPTGQMPLAPSGAADLRKTELAGVPTPLLRPDNLPAIEQPYQVTVVSLKERLDNLAFDLAQIRQGKEVPRHFVENLPTDILDIQNVQQRKELFLSISLPLILKVNEDIARDRAKLSSFISAKAAGEPVSAKQTRWIAQLAKRYNGSTNDLNDLLARVDMIPASLALAQSIEESGWGTSRFARNGNALFGQRVWNSGEGLVPHERADGQQYEVKAFDKLLQSVENYALNLNRHPAYSNFRTERQRERRIYGMAKGFNLSRALLAYSERGEDYVAALQNLIVTNNLDQFDDIQLAPERFAQIFNSSNN